MFLNTPLNWESDEDCVRVAEFVIEWASADGEHDLNLDLRKISLWDFLEDILSTVEDDRYTDAANDFINKIGL